MPAGTTRFTLLYCLGLAAWTVICRLVPYYVGDEAIVALANFAPLGAAALFAGSRLRSPYAWALPLVTLLVSDFALWPALSSLGFSPFSLTMTPVRYASYLVYVLLGRLAGEGQNNPLVLGGAALLGGTQFFLVSNFAVWASAGEAFYSQDLAGLLLCYEAGLPFYRNGLAADLGYSALFFGAYALLLRFNAEKGRVPA